MQTVSITGIGSHLQGVGRLADGRVAFVPFAIPGEVVQVELERERDRFVQARLVRVLEPSPERVPSDCPAFGACGGCQARHMTYEATLQWKRRRVADALERIAGLDPGLVAPTLGMEDPLRCRNKVEFCVQGGRVGMLRGGSHEIVPVEDCLLQTLPSARAIAALAEADLRSLRQIVTRVNRRGEVMLTLCGAGAEPPVARARDVDSLYYCRLAPRPAHALDGVCRRLAGKERLEETLLGLRFLLHPQSFFQVNAAQAERLYQIALKAVEGAGTVLDVYCGAGTITLLLARAHERAVGVELCAPAVADARENARANGLADRVQFVHADAAHAVPQLTAAGTRFDAAILDPPRRGADALRARGRGRRRRANRGLHLLRPGDAGARPEDPGRARLRHAKRAAAGHVRLYGARGDGCIDVKSQRKK